MLGSRRTFLKAAPLAALALSATPAARAIAASDPIGRTRPGRLKLSLAAYSFRQWLESKQMSLFDFADLAAEYGVDAIEPTSYWVPADADAAYLHKLKLHAFKLGLDISGTAIRNDFCLPPGEKRDADLAHVRSWIDKAALLSAPVIRIFAGNVPKGTSEDAAIDRVVEGIESVLPYAQEKGVLLALENHGGITAEAETMLRIVRAVKGPNFGVNLDTGNFRTADPYGDLAKIAPYALNVQVKTEIAPNGKKQEADLAKLFAIFREAKYSGYVVLEYEAAEDALKAVPRHLKDMRKLIDRG